MWLEKKKMFKKTYCGKEVGRINTLTGGEIIKSVGSKSIEKWWFIHWKNKQVRKESWSGREKLNLSSVSGCFFIV